jgi:hypothetical protein
MTMILPRLPRGRPSGSALAAYSAELRTFCDAILKINSRLDFRVGSRGWCYILEEHGLGKGDFDDAQELIAECRRRRLLPMDIVAEDGAREFNHLEDLDEEEPEDFAAGWVEHIEQVHSHYRPISFWNDKDVYIQMIVEKIDLKSLFDPICKEFCIPLANARGWSDLNMRWALLQRIREHLAEGRKAVILYCGDHDPSGLNISNSLRSNLAELLTNREWLELMDHLTIDRFGLNFDFIERHGLTWIDGLVTSSGQDLASSRHKDHKAAYVQDYLSQFGARKCEANALVVRPDAGRELCRQAILKYLPADAPARYLERLAPYREQALEEIQRQLLETLS